MSNVQHINESVKRGASDGEAEESNKKQRMDGDSPSASTGLTVDQQRKVREYDLLHAGFEKNAFMKQVEQLAHVQRRIDGPLLLDIDKFSLGLIAPEHSQLLAQAGFTSLDDFQNMSVPDLKQIPNLRHLDIGTLNDIVQGVHTGQTTKSRYYRQQIMAARSVAREMDMDID